MKKFLLMLGAVALLTACSKNEEGPGGGSGGSINYEEGYKYLTSLNVSDAKMIYQKSSTTRAAGDEDGYYKIDFDGEESKLVIKGEDEQIYNIGINQITKLSDRILLINPDEGDVVDLIKPDDDADYAITVGMFLSLVDVETEKIYKFPEELNAEIILNSNVTIKSATDNQGNVYFSYGSGYGYEYSQIYKLDISEFTMQPMLADGQRFTDFDVTGDGFIIYWDNNSGDKNYKVKCPGGRMYPITDIGFILKDELYSYKDKKIVKWEPVGDNELKETEICVIPEFDNYPDLDIQGVLYNYVLNTVLLQSNYSGFYYEFDGKQCQLRELNGFYWYENDMNNFCTGKAWYKRDNTRFTKMSMETYQESEFQVLDYEIQNLFASPESPDITFEGIDYANSTNVVGRITESDEIIIDKIANNGQKIINLIPLN